VRTQREWSFAECRSNWETSLADFSSHGGSRPQPIDLSKRPPVIDAAAPGGQALADQAETRHRSCPVELGASAPVVALAWRWEQQCWMEAPGFNRSAGVLGPAARTALLTRAAACPGIDRPSQFLFWLALARVGLGRLLGGRAPLRIWASSAAEGWGWFLLGLCSALESALGLAPPVEGVLIQLPQPPLCL